VAVGNDSQFAHFAAALGLVDLATDVRFVTNAGRVEHRADLIPILSDAMKTRTTAAWEAVLNAVNVPAGPINTIEQALADPQAQFRNLATNAGGRPGIATPLRLSDSATGASTAPPLLGADTAAVLSSLLGLDDDMITRLRAKGAI
jgi:crotonobetainyl-CoA:carnitine CoA-transferase CaiB-like acyl-CoA transferase